MSLVLRSEHRKQRRLLRLDVEELGSRALLGLAHGDALGRDGPRDLRAWVVEVTREDRVHGTDDDARGLEAHVGAVRAEMARGGRARFWFDVDRVASKSV